MPENKFEINFWPRAQLANIESKKGVPKKSISNICSAIHVDIYINHNLWMFMYK